MKHLFVFDYKIFKDQQWKMDFLLDSIGQFFRVQEKPNFSVHISRFRRNAVVIIQKEADKAEPDDIIRVYAIGGKEILFDCLNGAVLYPNIQLVSVPYGETSGVVVKSGLNDKNLLSDITSIVNAEAFPTDIIGWGPNYALNSCSIGIRSEAYKIIKNMNLKSVRKRGISFSKIIFSLLYFLSAFDKQVTRNKYNVTIDDNDYTGHYSLIHVTKESFHAEKNTEVSDAAPDHGLLNITLIKSSNPLKTLWTVSRFSDGERPKNSIFIQGEKITIQSNRQMWIQLDDEYIQDTSINLNLLHDALQMAILNDLS